MQFKIGDLARELACSVSMIRFYEKKGLLKAPPREDNNYRRYGEEDAQRLRFILHCRRHGLGLGDIGRLLAFRDKPVGGCAPIHRLLEKQLEEVEVQIASLLELKKELIALNQHCDCENNKHCAIMDSLESPENCSCCHFAELAPGPGSKKN